MQSLSLESCRQEKEIRPPSILRKPALATCGYSKPFLCPSRRDHAVVIWRILQTIKEILPFSILREPALATWGYSKPFLCPWRHFTNTVSWPVKENSVHWCTVNSSSYHAVVISRIFQTSKEIRPSSILRKPALATWGYSKPFLCSWRRDHAIVISRILHTIKEIRPFSILRKPALATWGYSKPFLCPWRRFTNTVLRPVKEDSVHGCTLDSSSYHAVVISRILPTSKEIRPSSILRKPALVTWGYSKPFLCLWSRDHAVATWRILQTINEISPFSIPRKPALATWGYSKPFLCKWRRIRNTVLRPVKKHSVHGCTVDSSSYHAVVNSRILQTSKEIRPSSILRKPTLATWRYSKPILCPWRRDHAVVNWRILQTIKEIRPFSILRKPALATWGYSKPFLCPWRYFTNTVLRPVKEDSCTVDSSSYHAVVISRILQTSKETRPSSILRQPALATCGYSKPFLCPWRRDHAVVIWRILQTIKGIRSFSIFRKPALVTWGYSKPFLCPWRRFTNTVLRLIKEHLVHWCMVYSSSYHAVVISKPWQTVSEIGPSSILRKSALATWGYCKPFLCPWRRFTNIVFRPVKEDSVHGCTVHSSSYNAVIVSRILQTVKKICPSSILRKPALATWEYCKPFLCPLKRSANTVLRPVKEHSVYGCTVYSSSYHSVVISKP